MTRRKGVPGRGRRGLQTLLDSRAPVDHDRGQGIGLSGHRSAAHQPRREPGDDRRERRLSGRGRPRSDFRRRAFLRRLEARSPITRSADRARGRRAGARLVVLCDTNGGSMPEDDRRHHPGGRGGRCPCRWASIATTIATWPWPTRLAARRCRGGAGAGHHQRLRRALRQRRPDLGDRQPGLQEAGLRGARRRRRRAPDRAVAVRLRDGQHELPLEPAFRGQERVCPQGRNARQRHRPRGRQLRAHRPGAGGQRAARAGERAFGAVQHRGPAPRGTISSTTRSCMDKILAQVVSMENAGYQFEAADGSFDLLVRRCAGHVPAAFRAAELSRERGDRRRRARSAPRPR